MRQKYDKFQQDKPMKILPYCMLAFLAMGCTPKKVQNTQPDELLMLVGTYTDSGNEGIYTFRFNQITGQSAPLASFKLPNPSYLIPSENGKRVYAVSEMNDSTASLSALALDKTTGQLSLLNTLPTLGADPCYVATNGQEVVTANYSGGTMSIFPLEKDGRISPVDTLFEGTTGGNDPNRQNKPHIHCTLFSPDGKYIYATDFSSDRILRFVLHPNDIVPHPSMEAVQLPIGSGPRHLTFSPNGNYAYLINELSGKVVAFAYSDGTLKQIQTITADTSAARGSADIHVSPDGKYLYTSNRLKNDGIAIFAIDQQNGTLAKAGYQQTGIHPRNFQITPNGKFLLAACRDSHVIQVFERDLTTGLLRDTRQNIKIDKPTCIQFVR